MFSCFRVLFMFPYDYFTIPNAPDFFDDNFELVLTEESKRLFRLGRPKQGYVGLVELPLPGEATSEGKRQGKIHLMPADNKKSGRVQGIDINGNKFKTIVSSQQLGSFTGDVHTMACASLGLVEKAGAKGFMMGFGLWKSGCGIKILDYMPENSAMIPNEYLLIKENGNWSVYFTEIIEQETAEGEAERVCYPPKKIEIDSIVGLREALDALPTNKDIYQLSQADREIVEDILQNTEPANIEKPDEIGHFRNRSSSQNASSIKKSEELRFAFKGAFSFHSSHLAQFIRELPLPVLQKIINNIVEQLGLDPIPNLIHSKTILGGSSGPLDHFQLEDFWGKASEEARKDFIFQKSIRFVSRSYDKQIKEMKRTQKDKPKQLDGPEKHHRLYEAVRAENMGVLAEAVVLCGLDPAETVKKILKQGKYYEASLVIDYYGEKLIGYLSDVLHEATTDRYFWDDYLIASLIKRGVRLSEENEKNKPLIMRAALQGNENVFNTLLQEDLNLNLTILLYHAIQSGNLNIVKAILSRQPGSHNATFRGGESVVSVSIRLNRMDIFEEIIKNDPSALHDSLLYCYGTSEEVVRKLISLGANVNSLNISQRTPLMNAIFSKSIKNATILLESGADITLLDKDNHSALYYALMAGHFNIVDEILNRANSDPNPEILKLCLTNDPDLNNTSENSLLSYLIEKNKTDMARIVLENMSVDTLRDISLQERRPKQSGRTYSPLLRALEKGNNEMVSLILEKDPEIIYKNHAWHDGTVNALIEFSLRYFNENILDKLIERDPDLINRQINTPPFNGFDLLTYAVNRRFPYKTVEYLVQKNSSSLTKPVTQSGQTFGHTLLMIAILYQVDSLIDLFLKIDPTLVNDTIQSGPQKGKSALMLAIETGQPHIVKKLLEYSPDLSYNWGKNTVYDILKRYPSSSIKSLLPKREKAMIFSKKSEAQQSFSNQNPSHKDKPDRSKPKL